MQYTCQRLWREMRNVERYMPINPEPPKYWTQPALAVWTTYPDLPSRIKNACHMSEHFGGIKGMLQHIRQHDHIIFFCWLKLFDQIRINHKAFFSRHIRCLAIQLQPFHGIAAALVMNQATPLIATHIQQTALAT